LSNTARETWKPFLYLYYWPKAAVYIESFLPLLLYYILFSYTEDFITAHDLCAHVTTHQLVYCISTVEAHCRTVIEYDSIVVTLQSRDIVHLQIKVDSLQLCKFNCRL